LISFGLNLQVEGAHLKDLGRTKSTVTNSITRSS